MKAPSMEIINGRRIFYLGAKIDSLSGLNGDKMLMALEESIEIIEANKAMTIEDLEN